MPKEHKILLSFNSGELSPLMSARIDFDKREKACRTLENFIPLPHGPAQKRSGLKYIAGTKTNTKKSRLVPFRFSTTQAYMLEFGDLYIRFFKEGGQIETLSSNVKLLLHANGNDASTTFTDSSLTPHTITTVGNAQIDTEFKKFGTGSILLDGTGDYLTVPDHADWDFSDEGYAIDAWVRPQTGNTAAYTLFSQRTDADNWIRLYLDSNVSLLLRGDGVDGSTTFTDDSLTSHTVTGNGTVNTPEIDTAQSKFGGSSVLFDSSDKQYLTVPDHADFDFSGEIFTFNAWVRISSLSSNRNLFSQATDSSNYIELHATVSSGLLVLDINDGGVHQLFNHSTALTVDTWHHVMAGSDGTDLFIAIDGVVESTTKAQTIKNYTGTFNIGVADKDGALGANESWFNGWMDDIRVIKGVITHTATFTKPTVRHKMFHPVFELRIGASTETLSPDAPFDENIDYDEQSHIQIDGDGTKHYLFANGILQNAGGTNMTNAPTNFTQIVYIGGHHNDTTVVDLFKGNIDELRVYIISDKTADFTPREVEYGLNEGSTPTEVTTPYLEEDLFELKFTQSADVLYIAHEDYAPRKLLRFSDTSWRLDTIGFLPPPLKSEEKDFAVALTLNVKTVGDNQVATPASEIFVNGDVGKEIREIPSIGKGRATVVAHNAAPAPDTLDIDIFVEFSGTSLSASEWKLIGTGRVGTLTISNFFAGGQEIILGEIPTLTSSNNAFLAADVGKYITTDDGTASITYKIVAFSSATVVSGIALSSGEYDSDVILQQGEWEIKLDAWNATDGFPNANTFFENRLIWAGSPGFPQTIWASAVDNYENHELGSDDANAYEFTLAARQVNVIRWLVPGDVLLVGTEGAEWVVGSSGAGTPLTATNVNTKLQTAFGSENVQPGNIGQAVLFLQKHARKVREMVFSFDVDRYVAPDLTLLAEHVTRGGIIEMDFQNEPNSILWCVRNVSDSIDNQLLGLTYLREQDVVAWHRHLTDGKFESIGIIPGDEQDDVWVIVNRTIGGATKRYVELLQPLFDDNKRDLVDAFFVDSGITYDGGPATVITGLDHLEGEAVDVLADGLVVTGHTVSSGAITLTTAASVVHAGLNYTGVLQPMRLEAGQDEGTAQGRIKRINNMVIRFFETLFGNLGPNSSNLDSMDGKFTAGTLLSGDVEFPFKGDYELGGDILFTHNKPTPCTVICLLPEVRTATGQK